jgi:hypothetical protein
MEILRRSGELRVELSCVCLWLFWRALGAPREFRLMDQASGFDGMLSLIRIALEVIYRLLSCTPNAKTYHEHEILSEFPCL